MTAALQAPIVLAGASGDLGGRIAQTLVARGAAVRALVRPDAGDAERSRIEALGAATVVVDPTSVDALATACAGAGCVVSALNGVRDAIVDRQTVLLDAAVRAGVPRFIPSDYAADFTKTEPGRNRNYDLRREFMARVNSAPIRATSILNGAFMDMLGAEMPIIRSRLRRVLYWRDARQPLDFTNKDDTAAYTAAAALDDDAPRILRIAGGGKRARHRGRPERGNRPPLPDATRGRTRRAVGDDRCREAGRARARRSVPALARHAVHA